VFFFFSLIQNSQDLLPLEKQEVIATNLPVRNENKKQKQKNKKEIKRNK